jgi:hypothetical protein
MASAEPVASVDTAVETKLHPVDLGPVQVQLQERGSGEPVLLLHAALLADWFRPLLVQTNLSAG